MTSCVLCGDSITRKSKSREHVIAQWIRCLCDERWGPAEGRSEYRRILQERAEQPIHQAWQDKGFELKVRVLCESCNTGFLSDIEGHAKPYLSPLIIGTGPVTLDAKGQLALAIWAMKTILMMQFTHVGKRLSIPLHEHRWFRQHRWPTSGTQIWLAAYDGRGDFPVAYHHYGLSLAPAGTTPGTDINGHVVALAVGHAVFRVFGNTLGQGTIPTPGSRQLGSALRQIWPTTSENVLWPPPVVVSGNSGLRKLVDTIGPNYGDFEPSG